MPRKVVSLAVCGAWVATVSAGTALAAGNGYGGSGGNGVATPAGFSAVSAVYTVNASRGGTVGKGSIHFKVPAGAKQGSLALVFYKGKTSTVTRQRTTSLAKDKVLVAFGIGIFSGSTATKTSKPITVTYTSPLLKAGDKLAVYNSLTHKFSAVKATFSKGKVTFLVKAGQSVAILS